MLTAVLAAFLGGLILNVMPCVLPIISLKLLSLAGPQDAAARRREGLAYLAGVLITMLALASILIALRTGGAAVGWGFQLQSPVMVGILVLVMSAAALNLAGVFEFGLAAQRLVGGIGGDKQGVVGATLTGALAVLVATPCTGPFMAGAMGYALVQPPGVTLLVFAALALGFASPFVVIALVPQLGRFLPRPGAWMETFKHALAFPMFGAAAWLVWVLAQQSGAGAVGLILASVVVMGFALWLYGHSQRRRLSGKGFRVAWAASIALIAFAITPLAQLQLGDTPNYTSMATGADHQAWSPDAVAQLKGKGRPVFVDFTAAWCVTCQVNEKTTLSTRAVKEALAETNAIYMVADSTHYNQDVDDALLEFGHGGLPLYVVYPAHEGEPQVLPQLLNPSIVVDALHRSVAQVQMPASQGLPARPQGTH